MRFRRPCCGDRSANSRRRDGRCWASPPWAARCRARWPSPGLPASTATLIIQAQVPFAVLAAWLVCGERVTPRRLAGITVALCGVAIVVGLPETGGRPAYGLLVVLG